MKNSTSDPHNFYKHISKASSIALKEIEGRKRGKIKSLSTGLSKLDKATMNGFE